MTKGVTDRKASVPLKVRRLIIKIWGQEVMDAFDRHGRKHDSRLQHKMSRWIADRMMVSDCLRDPLMPWQIIVLLWPALALYAALPDSISDLYWLLIP